MKSTTQSSKRARKPKANRFVPTCRVMWASCINGYPEAISGAQTDPEWPRTPVTVMFHPSAARAKKLARFVNKGEEGMVEVVAKAMCEEGESEIEPTFMRIKFSRLNADAKNDYRKMARACLIAAGLIGRGE